MFERGLVYSSLLGARRRRPKLTAGMCLALVARRRLFALSASMAVVASRAVNINRFSLHGCIAIGWSARISAPRVERKPDPFTGFDASDNVRMHKLRPPGGAQRLLPTDQCHAEPAAQAAGLAGAQGGVVFDHARVLRQLS